MSVKSNKCSIYVTDSSAILKHWTGKSDNSVFKVTECKINTIN